jgi:cell division protein FtsW (lipid II flippase)
MELVKLLLVVFLAGYLEEYRELLALAGKRLGPLWLPPMPYLAPMLVMVLTVLSILAVQGDFGPALLLFTVMLVMLYAASGRRSYLVLGLSLVVLGGVGAARVVEHVRVRVDNWLDPWSQAAGSGYQLVQALYALASGGVIGAGLDAGSPRYIPAVHTDFIIAAIGEELGLIGSLAVVNLFVVLTLLGLRIALRARSGFNALLATGVTAVLALQALIILAGTLKLIPMTGITLPFVSYGGSSVLVNFLLIGLLLSVSQEENARLGP